jgi:hypothetical protein
VRVAIDSKKTLMRNQVTIHRSDLQDTTLNRSLMRGAGYQIKICELGYTHHYLDV